MYYTAIGQWSHVAWKCFGGRRAGWGGGGGWWVCEAGADRVDLIQTLQKSAAIVVTTSGMLQGGPVVQYAQKLLPQKRNRLFLTGFQEESTLGGRVRRWTERWNGTITESIADEFGEKREIRIAQRPAVISLSAHADQAALIAAAR